MITLLEKIFLKNKAEENSSATRQAYGMLCGALGIFLNIFLFIIKFLAGFFSHSIAITADAFNNLSDAGSSIITLIGFKMAGQKPDPDHPFGHGRIEYVSGFLVAIVIFFMAYELIQSSVNKILHPEELIFSPLILIILVVSILVKLYMSFYNYKLGKKISSAAMLATAKDSISDTLATFVVLLCTLFTHFTNITIDGYCGILVGLFILYVGYTAARDTINPLLGEAPEPEFTRQIEEIVMSYEDVLGIHDLIVHNYGPGRLIISLHAEVSADGDMLSLHDTIDLIEHRLNQEMQCLTVIHMDPVCIHDEFTMSLKQMTLELIAEIDSQITMHDFRVVSGPTHTNLVFDIVVPYNYKYTDREITEIIQEKVKEKDENYFVVIDVDKKYA